MWKFGWLCMLGLLPYGAFGQFDFRALILDAETFTPVSSAYIGAGDTTRYLATSDADGIISFSLGRPKVEVQATHLNYADTLWELRAGQTDTFFWSRKGFQLQTVSVRARSMLPALMRKSGSIQTLNPELLEQTDGLSIRTGLNLTPGVYMHSGALNTNRITIRGIGNRSPFTTAKIRAYLDDIPLTSGAGETTLEDLDLAMLEQVQVYKGPAPVHYGAGLGGLIQLQTLDPAAMQRQARLRLTAGAFGRLRQVYEWQDRSKDRKMAYNVQLHGLQSDGYRENNRYDRKGASLIARFGSEDGQLWRMYVNYIDLFAQIPSSLSETDFHENPRQAAFTWANVEGFEDSEKLLVGLSFRQKLGRLFRLSVSGSTLVRDGYERRPFNVLTEENRVLAGRMVLEYLPFQKNQMPRFSVGMEPFREVYTWRTYETLEEGAGAPLSDNEEVRNYWNGFMQANWPFAEQWTLEGGLHFHQTRYTLSDLFTPDSLDISGSYAFTPIWSPQIALRYRGDFLRWSMDSYVLLNRGFSTPTLEETLTPEGALNPDLEPEKGWNLEWGASGWVLTERLQYMVALFTMRVTDLLVARRTGLDQYMGINAGSTLHNGVETQWSYNQPLPGKSHYLDVFVNYTYSGFKFLEFLDEEDDFSGNALTGAPPHMLSGGLHWSGDLGGMKPYVKGTFQWVDAIPVNDANTVFAEPYGLLHVKTGVNTTFKSVKPLRLHVFAGVNNVLDKSYASMLQINAQGFGSNAPRYYYPGLPRHLFGGIEVSWLFN